MTIPRSARLPDADSLSTFCCQAHNPKSSPWDPEPADDPFHTDRERAEPTSPGRIRRSAGLEARKGLSIPKTQRPQLALAFLAGAGAAAVIANPANPYGMPAISRSATVQAHDAKRTAQVSLEPTTASLLQQPTREVPQLVEIWVTAEPAQAQVFLDGRAISNPLRVAYPADRQQHEVRALAPNYHSVTRRIAFDRDVEVSLRLEPVSLGKAPR